MSRTGTGSSRLRNLRRRRISRDRARRRREMLITALLIIFMLATGILLLKITAMRADADKRNVPVYKYYTTVEVSSGDTLWSIAEDHMSAEYKDIYSLVDEISALNHLKNRYLTAGEKICIPYYSTESR